MNKQTDKKQSVIHSELLGDNDSATSFDIDEHLTDYAIQRTTLDDLRHDFDFASASIGSLDFD